MKQTGNYLIPAFRHTFALAAMSLLLPISACQREVPVSDPEEQVTPDSGNTNGSVVISVSIEPETKATVADNGVMSFSSLDAIKIFDGTAVFTGVTTSTSSSGQFTMEEGFAVDGSGYAGFPARLVSDITSSGVTFVLPSTYSYAQVGGSDINAAKVTCPMIGTYNGGGNLALRHAGALVRFYVSDIKAGTLSFTFPTNVTGVATIATPTGTGDGILASNLSDAGKTITITGVPDVEEGDFICITLPVPTGTVPQNIQLENIGSKNLRFGELPGVETGLARADGHRFRGVTLNGLEAVDLGLEVNGKRILWANKNVGADSETEYGSRFAWGETEPKATYGWDTYKYGAGSITKYNESDNLTTLELSDDAARVSWGGHWRMPTTAEMRALQALSREWVSNYKGSGLSGYLLTALNGNTVFFPGGDYWSSSSVGGSHSEEAWAIYLSQWYVSFDYLEHRATGSYVRPVLDMDEDMTLGSVSINPESLTIWTGDTRQLSVTAKDVQGNPIPGAAVSWSVVSGYSATVNSTGLVSAYQTMSGNTTIRATVTVGSNTLTKDCTVYVKKLEKVTLELNDIGVSSYDNYTINVGENTSTFSAVAWDNEYHSIGSFTIVTWNSSNPYVVPVANGVAHGAAAGTATISASVTYKGVTVTSWNNPKVTVAAAPAAGVEAIDLGLSVKWANMNLGAGSVEEFGSYIAWGETVPKGSYLPDTYTNTDLNSPIPISNDAARINWGGTWRMPSKSEMQALASLPGEWVSDYNGTGVSGLKYTASNGNSIFLPAGGYFWYSGRFEPGQGYYWTTDPGYLHFYNGGSSASVFTSSSGCYYGELIRPVCTD